MHQGHTKATGQRSIDFAGLASFILLLQGIHDGQRAHIMETIRQLEHNHAGVLGHSQQHLAYRLRALAPFHLFRLLTALLFYLGERELVILIRELLVICWTCGCAWYKRVKPGYTVYNICH